MFSTGTMYFLYFLAAACISYASRAIVRHIVSERLKKKFKAFGSFTGKSISEFYFAVGRPNIINVNPDGSRIHVWESGGYSIAILFDQSGTFYQKLSETQQN